MIMMTSRRVRRQSRSTSGEDRGPLEGICALGPKPSEDMGGGVGDGPRRPEAGRARMRMRRSGAALLQHHCNIHIPGPRLRPARLPGLPSRPGQGPSVPSVGWGT